MKKLIAILMAVMMMCSVQAMGMENPWVELESLEALNEATGLNLHLPGIMGITNQVYRLLDDEELPIGEVIFEVNGRQFTLRGAPVYDVDISGVYVEGGKTAFEDYVQEGYAILTAESLYLCRWMDISGQYILTTAAEDGLDLDTFAALADELVSLTNPFDPVVLPDGTYYDQTSERAYAMVETAGEDTYHIEIHWSDSAAEDNMWTMTGVMTEDGLLTYDDCVMTRIVYDEEGNATEYVANLIPTGYFVPTENAFSWDGAAEEQCRDCFFVWAEE